MLVDLLTRATTLKPDLPLFPPDFQANSGAPQSSPCTDHHLDKVAIAELASHYVEMASQLLKGTKTTQSEDHRTGILADHPPHYPRPGEGLMKTLPPEQDDLQGLVDDNDRDGVFSHFYRADEQAKKP